jgi:uncharacterized membrane protein YhaH (DUF805 family)
MSQSESFLRSCLSLSAPVNRRTYFLAGFSLAAVKYLGDVALIWQATGQFWKPTDYLALTHSFFYTNLKGAPSWLLPALGLCVLPFLLIGVTLTLRRALDAGISPWGALAFFVPYFNYAVMAASCILPSNDAGIPPLKTTEPRGRRRWCGALL